MVGALYSVGAQSVQRSTNQLTHVIAAASHGTVYMLTNKLITVSDADGHHWQVPEMLAVSEHTGAVVPFAAQIRVKSPDWFVQQWHGRCRGESVGTFCL